MQDTNTNRMFPRRNAVRCTMLRIRKKTFLTDLETGSVPTDSGAQLKVHKNENFFGFDFEFCPISLLVMHK